MKCHQRFGLCVSLAVTGVCGNCGKQGEPPAQRAQDGSIGSLASDSPAPEGTVTAGGQGGSSNAVGDAAARPLSDASRATGSGAVSPAGPDGSQPPPTDPGPGMDETPDRPLNVDKQNPRLYTVVFKPTDADSQSTGRNLQQTAMVDTSKAMQKKLVVVLAGSNGAPGPIEVASFSASLGFHAYAIAYHNEYDASTYRPANPDVFGNSRFNELDGKGRTPSQENVPRPESIEVRLAKALPYLQSRNPQGDWTYYLQKTGDVRWSDVIFIGHSHGASSAGAYAKMHRLWRAISLSGPRDTNPVVATWLTLPSVTPIDRYYGFTGTLDSQHADHIKAMEIMHYLGALTSVEGAQPPFGGSHRLQYKGDHGASANCGNYPAVCRYMLGVQ